MSGRVVFLDCDGVLNSDAWQRTHSAADALSPAHVGRVDAFCRNMGAAVVVVSAWRYFYDLDKLRAKLATAGLTVPVLGAVGTLAPGAISLGSDDGRVAGAEAWLAAHPEVRAWVVFDDDPGQPWTGALWEGRWVRPNEMHGISAQDIVAGVWILGRDAR